MRQKTIKNGEIGENGDDIEIRNKSESKSGFWNTKYSEGQRNLFRPENICCNILWSLFPRISSTSSKTRYFRYSLQYQSIMKSCGNNTWFVLTAQLCRWETCRPRITNIGLLISEEEKYHCTTVARTCNTAIITVLWKFHHYDNFKSLFWWKDLSSRRNHTVLCARDATRPDFLAPLNFFQNS